MPRLHVTALVVLLLDAGCGGSAGDDHGDYHHLDYAPLNETIEQAAGAAWTRSPRQIVLHLAARRLGSPVDGRVTQEITADDRAVVTVLRDNLGDDSIKAVRHAFEFERAGDNTWRIAWIGWQQQCRLNRGHQDFSPDPCV